MLALILSPKTVPKVSAYRPDFLFQTVIDIWGGHPNGSRLSEDSQDGPLIMASGNGPKQDSARWMISTPIQDGLLIMTLGNDPKQGLSLFGKY